jgi:hypothetical protein
MVHWVTSSSNHRAEDDDGRAIAAHVMRNSGQETQLKWSIAKEGEFIFPLLTWYFDNCPHLFCNLCFPPHCFGL